MCFIGMIEPAAAAVAAAAAAVFVGATERL